MDQGNSEPTCGEGAGSVRADGGVPDRIGDVLIARRALREYEVDAVIRYQGETGLAFGDAALKLGFVSETDLKQAVAQQRGFPRIYPNSVTLVSGALVAARQPFCAQAEALRELRTRLKEGWLDAGHKSITVVGATPRAGRSHLAANLGVTFAQLGLATLVVDADFQRPAQHRMFGIGNRNGLETVLSKRDGLHLHRLKEIPELWVLPAGPPPFDPIQLLSADRFGSLIESLEKRFDVLLFDTPPLTERRDGEIVARRTGGALFVVRAHHSNADAEARCAADLAQRGVTVLGGVFNAA